MRKQKPTKRALLLSALSLLMCVSMLIGSTFAWFTDSVTSGNNKIIAGNLDVELYYQNEATSDWTKIKENSNIFMEDALWEPGHTEVIKLKVVNEGSLALKYQFAISVLEESLGINQSNAIFRLSDYIYFNLLDGELADDISRADAVAEAEDGAKKLSSKHTKSNELLSKNEDIVTLVVYMPESVGNDANYKTGTTAPEIKLGLEVFATQYTYESDSFGTDYDKDAYWTGDVNTEWYNTTDTEFTLVTAEQLAGLAEIVNAGTDSFVNKTVKLGANVDLNNMDWTPIGTSEHPFKGTFIGTGYTISNLYVTGTAGVGLFGYTFTGAHIEGVTVNKAYVSGNDYVGAILGKGYLAANCLKNCTVSDAVVVATPFQREDGQYDGGTKAGVIAGYALNGNVTGNKAYNSSVTAYRDLGGIVGMLAGDGIGDRTLDASGNEVNGIKLNYIGVAGAYFEGKVNGNMNDVVGRVGAKTTVGENTVVEVTKNDVNKDVFMIFTLQDLLTFAKEVNSGNTYAGKTVLLGADIDLNNMEWTPIGTGAGFNGTFDGNGKTISNLNITGNNSTVGLFANTYNGEIKNLIIENASVSGYLNVGVVAGNPYTSKYTNITVKGHVEVNGFAYVGGVGGKNAYANWTNITVDVDDTSYVKAISSENGKHYRTYVGGVIGFMGEGGHKVSNVTSNIDVIGDVCDIGGIVGIAHYNNKFENIVCTGDVTGTFFDPECPEDADEIGGIAGVWHNQNGTTVTFTDCEFTGKLTAADASVDVSDNTITGKAYSASGTGKLIIDGQFTENGVKYAIDENGGLVIDNAAGFTGSEFTVPEGVVAIDLKAFMGMADLKTVNFPSNPLTVVNGAFMKSGLESVVIPGNVTLQERLDGKSLANTFASCKSLTSVTLENGIASIPSGCFQECYALKSVTIPASVTSIAKKAFYDCLDLETVYLLSEDCEVGGQAFGSNQTGKFSNMTIYVVNEIMKERVQATLTDNNKSVVTVKVMGQTADAGELEDAISNAAAGNAILLPSGNVVIPDSAKGKELTFVGNGDTVIGTNAASGSYEGCNYALEGSTVVFENITITTDSGTYTGYARCNATFNNCTINGMLTLYGDMVFNDCTFNVSGDNYNIKTWGAPTAVFNNCTFNSDGKAMLLYGTENTKLTMNNCTFNDNGGLSDLKAAIEIGNDYGKSYELIVNDATVNGYEINDKGIPTGTTLWANKNSMSKDNLNVVVDGVDVY